MRMHDANVVVLRFGSQDVIATSGKPIAYTTGITTLSAEESGCYTFVDFCDGGDLAQLDANTSMYLKVSANSFGIYYIFGDCTKDGPNGPNYLLTVSATNDRPSGAGYAELTSESAIITWLIENAKLVSGHL